MKKPEYYWVIKYKESGCYLGIDCGYTTLTPVDDLFYAARFYDKYTAQITRDTFCDEIPCIPKSALCIVRVKCKQEW